MTDMTKTQIVAFLRNGCKALSSNIYGDKLRRCADYIENSNDPKSQTMTMEEIIEESKLSDRQLRLIACNWAERACIENGVTDERVIYAIVVSRRFAEGEASEDELLSACSAANDVWLNSDSSSWAECSAVWAAHPEIRAEWVSQDAEYAAHDRIKEKELQIAEIMEENSKC